MVIFCCVMHLWAAVTSAGRRLFNGFRPASPAGKTAGKAASDGPQFDTAGEQETALGPSVPYPSNQRVMELFEEQVKKQPSAVALVPDGALELTYADVN